MPVFINHKKQLADFFSKLCMSEMFVERIFPYNQSSVGETQIKYKVDRFGLWFY